MRGDILPAKLSLLIPRLASNHDGEILATVAAIRRVLSAAGLDLHDLASAITLSETPHGDKGVWRARARQLLRSHEHCCLSDWDAKFLRSISKFPRLSAKQAACLERIGRNTCEGRHRHAA